MTSIWYFNISNFSKEEYKKYINLLPRERIKDISHFFFFRDRVSRLIARILIRNAIMETGYNIDVFNAWELTANKKPFISKWMNFSISHSYDYVTLIFSSEAEVGIDIEKISEDIDFENITSFFTNKEKFIILNSCDIPGSFFDIWTRKESLLKGIGTGISYGLKKSDCSLDIIKHNDEIWYLNEFKINKNYKCYFSTNTRISEITFKEKKIFELC